MSLRISDFKSNLKGGGARPNLFRVLLNFPASIPVDIKRADFLVKSTSLPKSTIGEVAVKFRGRTLYLPGDRAYDTWSVTCLNDTDFDLRDAFQTWHALINNPESNLSEEDLDSLIVNLEVSQLGRQNQVLKTHTLFAAWPTNIGDIALSNETENAIEEFTVDFRYLHWV